MRSKLFAACLALVAFAAFAVPSLASASNTPLVVENNVAVPTETKVEGVNVGNTLMVTSLGTIECSTAIMTGKLTKNTTGTVEGDIETAKFGGTGLQQSGAPEPECTTKSFLGGDTTVTTETGTNGLPWCLRSTTAMATDEFQLRGGSCTAAARPIRFARDVTGVGACQYEKATQSVPIKGTFTTSETSSTISMSEQEFPAVAGNPFGCPSSGKLDTTFQLRTSGGGNSVGITS